MRLLVSSAALILPFTISLQCAGDVTGQFTAAPPTCPGDTFTFRCIVTGGMSGFTIWRVNGSSATFTVRSGTGFGTSATSFSSTLSGTATSALNAILVECFGPANNVDPGNRVGGNTLRILGPPSTPSLSCVDLSGDVSGAVNVTVSWTLSGGGNADFYLISITTNAPQTPYEGLLNITVNVTQQELTRFMAGYEYNITVCGVTANCGGLVGRESEPLTIRPQVPYLPANCASTVTYSHSTEMLLSIHNIWDTVPDPVDPCTGITGSITRYQISFQTGSVVATENVNIAECPAKRCSHTFEPPSNPPSSYDSVSVAAENVVGVGAARTCTTQTISIVNNRLTGVIVNMGSPADVQLQCTFLAGFTGSTHCTVQYGTDPTYMNLPYSAESTETGTAGDMVSVVLRERLNSSSVYYYTVSAVNGDITVRVRGTFMTPQYNCPLSELQTTGPPPDDKYPQCQPEEDFETSIIIPNGVVNVTCYCGRQFVSVASHLCDEGYQPNATSTVRVCRDSGLWSGTTVVCDSVQTTCSSCPAVEIAAAVAGTISLVIGVLAGFIAGVLVYYCISNHRSQSSKPESSSHQQRQAGPVYEQVFAEKLELRENVAYGPVQSIELRTNQAYEHVQR